MSNLPKTTFNEPTYPKSFRLPVEPKKRAALIEEIYTTIRTFAVKSNQLETYSKEDSRFINAVQNNALTNSELGKTK